MSSTDGLPTRGNMMEVSLPVREPRRSLAVRREALLIRADGLHVYRVNRQPGAERLVVESGVAGRDGSLSAGLEPRPEPANGSVQGGLRGSAQSL